RPVIDPAGAVADAVQIHAELVEQRQVKVRQRRLLRITDVASALQVTSAAARQQNRNVARVVGIAIAHTGPVNQRGVIDQRAIPFGGGAMGSSRYANFVSWYGLILAPFTIFSGSC